ncbi:MAG: hypothetical protein AABY83_05460 [Pseudomonadota bacterium]
MTDERPHDAFKRDLRAALDTQLTHLSAQELHKLRAARTGAMAATSTRRAAPRWAWSGLALAATVILAVSLWPRATPPSHAPQAIEDLELLAVEENLELYDELEFYTWLADENAPVPDPESSPRG